MDFLADYSDRYTDRSVVDKQYVYEGSFYRSDGEIPDGRLVTINTNDNGNYLELRGESSSNNTQASVYVGDNFVSLEAYTITAGVPTVDLSLTALSGATFTDSINGDGIKYHDDYSDTFVDRSLTDKAYVDKYSLALNNQVLSEVGTRTLSLTGDSAGSSTSNLILQSYNRDTYATSENRTYLRLFSNNFQIVFEERDGAGNTTSYNRYKLDVNGFSYLYNNSGGGSTNDRGIYYDGGFDSIPNQTDDSCPDIAWVNNNSTRLINVEATGGQQLSRDDTVFSQITLSSQTVNTGSSYFTFDNSNDNVDIHKTGKYKVTTHLDVLIPDQGGSAHDANCYLRVFNTVTLANIAETSFFIRTSTNRDTHSSGQVSAYLTLFDGDVLELFARYGAGQDLTITTRGTTGFTVEYIGEN